MEDIITTRIKSLRAAMTAIRELYAGAEDQQDADDLLAVLDVHCQHLESRRDGLEFTTRRLLHMKLAIQRTRGLIQRADDEYGAEIADWMVGHPVHNDAQRLVKFLCELLEDLVLGVYLLENNMAPSLSETTDTIVELHMEQERQQRAQRKKDKKLVNSKLTKGAHLLRIRPRKKRDK
jgi:hypothetical protein